MLPDEVTVTPTYNAHAQIFIREFNRIKKERNQESSTSISDEEGWAYLGIKWTLFLCPVPGQLLHQALGGSWKDT